MTNNPNVYTNLAKIQVILAYPKEIKDDKQTQDNVNERDDYIKKRKMP
jgi:hypothetical protein